MSNTLKIKNGPGAPPSLEKAELGFDTQNQQLYIGSEEGVVLLTSNLVYFKEGNLYLDIDRTNVINLITAEDIDKITG